MINKNMGATLELSRPISLESEYSKIRPAYNIRANIPKLINPAQYVIKAAGFYRKRYWRGKYGLHYRGGGTTTFICLDILKEIDINEIRKDFSGAVLCRETVSGKDEKDNGFVYILKLYGAYYSKTSYTFEIGGYLWYISQMNYST